MAARRLIVVMLALLAISTVIAMVTPQPGDRGRDGSATGASGSTGAAGATGATGPTASSGPSGAGGPADAAGSDPAVAGAGRNGAGAGRGSGEPGNGRLTRIVPASGPTQTIDAVPGQRLVVVVEVRRTAEIEIAGLGRLETATAYAPARFDLVLPPSPGRFEVTDQGNDTNRAVIVSSG